MDTDKPQTPIWLLVVRCIQFLLAIIIIGISASLIHGKYFNEIGFAIVCSLFTWLIVAYNILPAFFTSFHALHHVFIILGLDALMVIFWFSSMAANAALRGSFKYKVYVNGCYDDGSAVNSATCIVSRGAVASQVGLGEMSAVAGLSALNFLLFLAALIFEVIVFFRNRSKRLGTRPIPPGPNDAADRSARAGETQPGGI